MAGICGDGRERRTRTTGLLRCLNSFRFDDEAFEARNTLVSVDHPAAAARPLDFEPADGRDRLTHERYLGLLERAKQRVLRSTAGATQTLWGVDEARELW